MDLRSPDRQGCCAGGVRFCVTWCMNCLASFGVLSVACRNACLNAGLNAACRQAPEKSDKEITSEIQAIIRQITASVTFLPLLNDACKLLNLCMAQQNSVVTVVEHSQPCARLKCITVLSDLQQCGS